MAANPQPRFQQSAETQLERRIPTSSQQKKSYQFSREALIICWSTVSGLMIASFLFGFYSGREQGIVIALDKAAITTERIEISGIEELPQATTNIAHNQPIDAEEQAEIAAVLEPTELNQPKEQVVAGFAERTAVESLQASTKSPENPAEVVLKNNAIKNVAITTKKEIVIPAQVGGSLVNGFYVQVAAPNSSKEAQVLVQQIIAQNFSAGIQQAELASGTFHRVLVGPYTTASEAREAQKLMERSKLIKDTPFVRRIY